MLENPALPSWKFSFPHDNSSMEGSPNISPLLNPSPNQKILLKTPLHFPITITICKHWSKFVTCSPSHGDCGRIKSSLRKLIYKLRISFINKKIHKKLEVLVAFLINQKIGGQLGFIPRSFFLKIIRSKL